MEKILSLTSSVYAQSDAAISLTPAGQFNTLGGLSFSDIISAVVMLVLVIAALIAFFFLIYGGIKWITSGGDKEQTAAAQGTLTAAIIGLAIVFSTWAILNLIGTFFGIGILKSGGGGITIPVVGQ